MLSFFFCESVWMQLYTMTTWAVRGFSVHPGWAVLHGRQTAGVRRGWIHPRSDDDIMNRWTVLGVSPLCSFVATGRTWPDLSSHSVGVWTVSLWFSVNSFWSLLCKRSMEVTTNEPQPEIPVSFFSSSSSLYIYYICCCWYLGHSPENWTKEGAALPMK